MNEQNKKTPYKLYVSYVDKDLELFKEFKKHLTLLQDNDLIKIWAKGKIGRKESVARRKNAKEADIMLFLVSIELLIDPTVKNIEMKIALQRKTGGEDLTIIPVLIRRCHWMISALASFEPLPENKIPINLWSDKDDALSEVIESIHEIILSKDKDKDED
jgi:hypothetical protein